ncbi:hypothetical protein D9M68_530980 [compost metagenome]
MAQPASAQVGGVGAQWRGAIARPGVEEVAAEPEFGAGRLGVQLGQDLAAFRAGGERQLVLAEVFQLAVEAVVAARAYPFRGIAAIAMARAEVELDRQFQVMHPFGVAQQQVELAQGLPGDADRQVGRQQFHARCLAQGELPEPLVIESEAAVGGLRQPLVEGFGMLVQLAQPVGQAAGVAGPAAGTEGVALAPGRLAEQRR